MKGEVKIVTADKEIVEAIDSIEDELQKEMAGKIVRCFSEAGLPVKVKKFSRPKSNDRFRILSFIHKGRESVVINTDMWGFSGVAVQMRIFNNNSFERLDELTENLRSQILNSRDCGFCWSKCEGKQYSFSYGGTKYIKCQNFGCNFKFKITDENDVAGLIALTKREIDGGRIAGEW